MFKTTLSYRSLMNILHEINVRLLSQGYISRDYIIQLSLKHNLNPERIFHWLDSNKDVQRIGNSYYLHLQRPSGNIKQIQEVTVDVGR